MWFAREALRFSKRLFVGLCFSAPICLSAQSPIPYGEGTVVVEGDKTYVENVDSVSVLGPDWWASFLDKPGNMGGGTVITDDSGKPICYHVKRRYQYSGSISANWSNYHDGETVFFNNFVNNSDVEQSFEETISKKIKCVYDGSLTLSFVCLKAQTETEVEVKRVFPLKIPARGFVKLQVNANMGDKQVEMLTVCDNCDLVLGVYYNTLSRPMGLNGYYN